MRDPLLVMPPITLRVFTRGELMYCSTKCELRPDSGYSCKLGLAQPIDAAAGGDYVPMLKPGERCPMKSGSELSRTVVLTLTEAAASQV